MPDEAAGASNRAAVSVPHARPESTAPSVFIRQRSLLTQHLAATSKFWTPVAAVVAKAGLATVAQNSAPKGGPIRRAAPALRK